MKVCWMLGALVVAAGLCACTARMTNVLDAIAAQRLPISFYTDSSFSKRVRLQ